MLELRRILATEAVALAAERHTPEQLEAIEKFAEEQKTRVHDPIAYARGEFALERLIIRATGNIALELVLNMFARFPDDQPDVVAALYDQREHAALFYDLMIDLIRGGDPVRARNHMRRTFEMIDADWMQRHRPPGAPLPVAVPASAADDGAPRRRARRDEETKTRHEDETRAAQKTTKKEQQAMNVALTHFERRWAHAAFETIFPGPDRGVLPLGICDMDLDGFIDKTLAQRAVRGVASGCGWRSGSSRSRRSSSSGGSRRSRRSASEDRERVISAIYASPSTPLRATVMRLKAIGALFYCGDARVRPSIVAVRRARRHSLRPRRASGRLDRRLPTARSPSMKPHRRSSLSTSRATNASSRTRTSRRAPSSTARRSRATWTKSSTSSSWAPGPRARSRRTRSRRRGGRSRSSRRGRG